MLHTKFQGNRPRGSGEEFQRFYHYMHGGHLGHVTWTKYIFFPLCLKAADELKTKLAP